MNKFVPTEIIISVSRLKRLIGNGIGYCRLSDEIQTLKIRALVTLVTLATLVSYSFSLICQTTTSVEEDFLKFKVTN